MTKALFLRGRPGSSTVMIPSWPWQKDVFVYEDAPAGDIRQKDRLLLEVTRQAKPDVIFYMSVCPRDRQLDGWEAWEGITLPCTLRCLRSESPVVHICSDGGDSGWQKALKHYEKENCFDASINIDGVKDWPASGGNKNAMSALTPCPPVDPPVLVRPLEDREIAFGYFGSMGIGTKRHQLAEELKRTAGLKTWTRKCLSNPQAATYRTYCQWVSRCRINFNTAWSGDEQHTHVKGRVVESGHLGCCLMETAGSKTRDWFVPGEDYCEYTDAADCAARVKELLADLPRAQAMADSLRYKVTTRYNATRFWQQACDMVGVKCN